MIFGKKILILLITLILGIVGCSPNGSDEPQRSTVVSNNQSATLLAATDIVNTLVALTPTAGPSPTPTTTSTPYQTATPYPDADPDLIVGRIYDEEITLADYQARVRYERWLPLYAIARLLPTNPELLDLTRPENARNLQLFDTLGDRDAIGVQVMNLLMTESIAYREGNLRELSLPQSVFDGLIAARIGVQLEAQGARPPEWDKAYDQFIADMQLYTGLTEGDFLRLIQSQAYYDELERIIGAEAPLPNAEIVVEVSVQDLLANSPTTANEVRERLLAGESMLEIAGSLGLSSASGEIVRTIRRGDETLPEDIIEAIFDAQSGDVLGPIATDNGWYVALIGSPQLDVPAPSDLEAIRHEYFLAWMQNQLDDPIVAQDYDNWRAFIPLDPLPQDVSPLMRTEYFILPEDPFNTQE